MVPSVVSAALWYGDVQLVSFFLFCQFCLNYLFWNIFLDGSKWFPLFWTPLCLTCYLEPSWFPFSDF